MRKLQEITAEESETTILKDIRFGGQNILQFIISSLHTTTQRFRTTQELSKVRHPAKCHTKTKTKVASKVIFS